MHVLGTSCRYNFAALLSAGLPPPIVLVDEAVILGLRDRVKTLQAKMLVMQREAQYQVIGW